MSNQNFGTIGEGFQAAKDLRDFANAIFSGNYEGFTDVP